MKFIVKRNLNDYDSWKEVVSGNSELRKEKGSRGVAVYRSSQNPNQVYMVFEWDDAKPYRDYLDLPEVQEVLAATGSTEVIGISEHFSLEA